MIKPKNNKTQNPNNVENIVYYSHLHYKYSSLQKVNGNRKMHGFKRVAVFCVMTAVLPAALIILPLYLRHNVFADVSFPIAESDIMEIRDGISTIFCQQHSLQMNTSFNAFQISNKPEIAKNRKHIRLKKSMSLPDDTLEYWGFYLLSGASVQLKVCSRYDGSRILVVKGDRNLRTCGLLEHNRKKFGVHMADEGQGHVFVTFETAAEEIKTKPNEKSRLIINNVNDENDDKENKFNHGGEDEEIIDKLLNTNLINKEKTETENNLNNEAINLNNNNILIEKQINRKKRDFIIDRKINHGGNAINFTEKSFSNSDSESSFENDLLKCYDGKILTSKKFDPSIKCTNVSYLELGGTHMTAIHDVLYDGYYYYIFYSDNDYVQNDIHAVFDIFKPTYLYANITETKGCINTTYCKFPLNFWSDETVIVEVPTRDGIEHEDDDTTILISSCHPRMAVYVIFPILVLFLILSCAFL